MDAGVEGVRGGLKSGISSCCSTGGCSREAGLPPGCCRVQRPLVSLPPRRWRRCPVMAGPAQPAPHIWFCFSSAESGWPGACCSSSSQEEETGEGSWPLPQGCLCQSPLASWSDSASSGQG